MSPFFPRTVLETLFGDDFVEMLAGHRLLLPDKTISCNVPKINIKF